MAYGAIYIAHNPKDGDEVFIVKGTVTNVEQQIDELNSAPSNLGTYEIIASHIVSDVGQAQKSCHDKLGSFRIQPNRDFFEIPLPQLLAIVDQATRPFEATIIAPKTFGSTDSTTGQDGQSPSALLQAARNEQADREARVEQSKIDAAQSLEAHASYFAEKAKYIEGDLGPIDFLKWEVHPEISLAKQHYRNDVVYFRAKLYGQFKHDPLLLYHSEYSRGDHPVDLSNAVDEPEVVSRGLFGDDSELIEWQEYDDGRIADFYIEPGYSYETQDGLNLTTPKFVVGVKHHQYDWRNTSFKSRYETASFDNSEQAYFAFLNLLIANIKQPQFDVRKTTDALPNNKIKFKVSDRSVVDISALSNH